MDILHDGFYSSAGFHGTDPVMIRRSLAVLESQNKVLHLLRKVFSNILSAKLLRVLIQRKTESNF